MRAEALEQPNESLIKMLTDKEKNKIAQMAIEKILLSAKAAGIDFMALPKTLRYLVVTAYQQGATDALDILRGGEKNEKRGKEREKV